MRTKWSVLFLIRLVMMVAYCDRVNLTVAAPRIMAALHIGKPQFGYILAAFTLGYALVQAPGGFLADRFGARRILVAAVVLWSIFTALTGLAAALGTMLAIRFLFGVGEGIESGAQSKLIGDYFLPRERSQANGLCLTALALGPALASPLASSNPSAGARCSWSSALPGWWLPHGWPAVCRASGWSTRRRKHRAAP